METSKRGISQITGKTEIKLGEKALYKVTRIYRMEDHDKVKNALWKIYVKENGSWRELKSSPTAPLKKGDEVTYTITNQRLFGKELLIEAYIYKPEMKIPPGLKIKVVAGDKKKIHRVKLFMADDTPITENTVLKYNQSIKVKVYTQNMPKEFLKLTLYEDDATGAGHNPKNEKNKVAEVTKLTNANGFLWHEFKLNADFSKIANAMMDGSSDKLHEYYVLVESEKYGKKASKNAEIDNPDYIVHQTYENGKVTDHKKVYGETLIEQVIIKGKYKKQMGINPIANTGRSVSVVGAPPEKDEEKCDCKKYDLVWGDKIGCSERKKVVEVAKKLSIDPNWLMTVIALETIETFSPSIDNGIGYIGLIQFGKTTAETIGTTKDDLGKMSFIQQMDYVEKHLSQKRFQEKFKTLTDLYLAVLYPTACGHGSERNYVVLHGLAYRNNPLFFKEKGEWEYAEKINKNGKKIKKKVPTNLDGNTYVWEIAMTAQEIYTKGLSKKENIFNCNISNESKHESLTCPENYSQCFNYADVWENPEISNDNQGKNNNRYGHSKRGHKGIDILSGPTYKEVHSLMCGTIEAVVTTFKTNQYGHLKLGNVINVKSKDKNGKIVYILYCHLDKVYVKIGQKVKHGEKIALSGSTGNASYSGLPNGIKGHGIDKKNWHCHIEACSDGAKAVTFFGKNRLQPEDYMKTKFDKNGDAIK